MIPYVAAYRTYSWDEDVAELARRFFAATPNARQVVLADETRGKLPIPEQYEVIGHTEDTSSFAIPNEPEGGSLWFNVDYGVYFLRRALPDHDYYVLSESDLAVNLNLEPMVAVAAEERIDIVTQDVARSDEGWVWHPHGVANYGESWQSLLCFMVLSAKAIDFLLGERQRLAVEFSAGRLEHWPFCEPFVASSMKRAGMRFEELSRFADTENLRYRPRIALYDERANRPGSLVHSVLGSVKFTQAAVWDAERPRDWFFPNTELAAALRPAPLGEYADNLMTTFRRNRDHASMLELALKMQEAGLPVTHPDAAEDLALGRPALASSTSQWSRHPEPAKDAAGANGIDTDPEYGFHTDMEDSPWWMVDLGSTCSLDQVRIVSRPGLPERFVSFVVESSSDTMSWTNRYTKLDLAAVSADEDAPFVIDFPHPFVARYVRIRLVERGVIHLRRISMFGRRLSPTLSAL